MGMNIKNGDAHRLARELAELTGESLTEAVTVAVRERLARLRHGREKDVLVKRLRDISVDAGSRVKEPWKSIDHAELLYDDRGLPHGTPR